MLQDAFKKHSTQKGRLTFMKELRSERRAPPESLQMHKHVLQKILINTKKFLTLEAKKKIHFLFFKSQGKKKRSNESTSCL